MVKDDLDNESACDEAEEWVAVNTERIIPYLGKDAPIIVYEFDQ